MPTLEDQILSIVNDKAYSPVKPKVIGKKLKLEREDFFAIPADHYTIQLAASSSLPGIKGIIRDNHFEDKARYLALESEGMPAYLLIYGDYASYGEAMEAAERLRQQSPATLHNHRTRRARHVVSPDCAFCAVAVMVKVVVSAAVISNA